MCIYIIIIAPKRAATRVHPDPKSTEIVDDPEKILKIKSLAKSQGSSSPPHREDSLPKYFLTMQDIYFDLPFEQSLFITKSANWVD